MSLLNWTVNVDWDNDGTLESNEAIYMTSIRGSRGRRQYIKNDGIGFDKLQTGVYYLTLDNNSGRYDAWNSSSPLYPNVSYGVDVQITVEDAATSTTYPVFYGVIQDIQPQVNNDGDAFVVVTVVDGFNVLRNYNATKTLYQNITPGAAIGHVLDAAGWLSRWDRDLDTGAENIRYWWASGDQTAASSIEDIADSFLGYFFIAADGKATYRTQTNVGSSVANLTEAVLLKDISLPQPWQNSRNVTVVTPHPLTTAASGVIYQLLGSAPAINASSSITIWGDYAYNNERVSAASIIAPVATTDFTMNTQSNGGGTNKTSDCTVTATDFGDRVKLVVANNSSVTVYVTLLQLRGVALYEAGSSTATYPASLPAVPRQFTLDLPWRQDVNAAEDYANFVGPFLATKHPFPIVQLEGRPSLQFAPDLFELVTLTSAKYGISSESFRVAYIEHESLTDTCQSVRTKFYLEAYIPPGDYWIWDTASVFDTSTIFGAVS